MQRSEVNEIMARAADFIRSFEFHLPPFAHWSPEEFVARKNDARAIIETRMGWDITDFGRGKFNEFGLFLFTLRNGRVGDLAKGRGMLYAEKLLVARKGQQTPMHRHNLKAEDIINRGGGTMCMEIYMSRDDGSIDDKAMVEVPTDGVLRRYKAGEILKLKPGESVTLMPGVWHGFWIEVEEVLIGEVSTVNDDVTDNVFRDPIGRFAEIDEDEAPMHLLVADYDKWLAA